MSIVNGILTNEQETQLTRHFKFRGQVQQKMTKANLDKRKETFHYSDKFRDKRKSKDGCLPSKEFVTRNSLLTDLFETNEHIRTIYNIFIVILIILFINTIAYDILETNSASFGCSTIQKAFGKFSSVIYIWVIMQASTISTYAMFGLWGNRRLNFYPKSLLLKLWDYGWLTLLVCYQIGFIIFPVKAIFVEDLPQASSIIILMEQVRLLMKTHAYVRSAAPIFLGYKPHTENKKPKGPSFSQFWYFLFAPTLIYRNNYPRTKKIRWKIVAFCCIEVITVVFYIAFTFERFLVPVFQHFGTTPQSPKTLLCMVLSTLVPGILVFLCGFYCLLHSWMNASAELLKFADRLFYKDWWNATSYGMYYRTWNVVVHDWLYTYIYKDMYESVTNHNKIVSTCAVFFASAVFHEYILTVAFRFFFPVLLVMFGGAGSGILLSLYSMEYYARINCPPHKDSITDFFLPRSLTC
ncbi:sterol O-acyltransferase 1 isoform X2 [Prorops nasuta]|uniref:sterol O-acyltransferase 1 isoform X2 n=1 Tax=Prorops nasuta TaxID=863751 RepID=UPI0034CD4E5C